MSTDRQSRQPGINKKKPAKLASTKEKPHIPAWRRIEAIQEKMALRGELTDIWTEEPDFDDSIFFPDEELAKRFYAKAELPSVADPGEDDIDTD